MSADAVVASVIICTRNRADVLARCLASLSADTSSTPAEVIVVDNGSTDATETVVGNAIEQSSRPMRYVSEPIAGLSHARNTGVRHAKSDLLLFADDDVVIHDGWLDALVGAFEPGVVGVGGRVIPSFPAGRPAWAVDRPNYLTFFDEGPEPFDMGGQRSLPSGANMAVRKSALPSGEPPFSPDLGSAATLSVGGEDVYVMHRLLEQGRIVYAPAATVDHPFEDPARLSVPWARRRSFLGGIGNTRFHRLVGPPPPDRAESALLTLRSLRYLVLVRLRNARRPVSAGAAQDEFTAYWTLGKHLEALSPRLATLAARILV